MKKNFKQIRPREQQWNAINHSKTAQRQKKRIENIETATNAVETIHLLKKSEIKKLFPTATIINERLFGLVNSFIILGGWDPHIKKILR